MTARDLTPGVGHTMPNECAVPVLVCGHESICRRDAVREVPVYCRWGHHERVAMCAEHEQMARDGRGRCRECHRDGYLTHVYVDPACRPRTDRPAGAS